MMRKTKRLHSLLLGLLTLSLSSCGPQSLNNNPLSLPGSNANTNATQDSGPPPQFDAHGLMSYACEQESNLKSALEPRKSKITFENQSDARMAIFWLDFNGKRQEYKKLKANEDHNQDTFVGHYWLIANDDGACLGIYAAESESVASLSLIEQGQPPLPSNLSAVTEANITAERAQQGIACLRAKGDSANATAVQGLLAAYEQFKPIIGEAAAKAGHLSAAVKVLNDNGC